MFICSAQIWLKIYTFGWLNLSIAINCLAFRFKHFNFVPKHHSIDSVIISNLLPYRSWHLLRPQKAAVNLNHFSFEDYQSGWTQCLICMVFFPKLLMFGSTRETISTARKSYLKYEDPAKMDFKTSSKQRIRLREFVSACFLKARTLENKQKKVLTPRIRL